MKTSLKAITNTQRWQLAAITLASALAMSLASTALAANAPNVMGGNATGTVGVVLSPSYQITANQSIPNGGWGATGLPPGLNGPSATGLISGTPTTAGSYTVHLSATNANGTGTKDVTFTINPPPHTDPAAVASISPLAVYPHDIVTLDGTQSDTNPPGGTLQYTWQQPSGQSVSLSGQGSATATFEAPAPPVGQDSRVVTFTLKVKDDDFPSLNDTSDPVTTTVYALPTANAGPDVHVNEGTLVPLNGSGTGVNLTYFWMAPAGITLSDPTAPNPTFTAPSVSHAGQPFTFTLVVTEHRGGGLPDKASAPDQVTINVDDMNQVPTAFASAVNDPNNIQSEGTVDESTDVTIYGFGTDLDVYDNPITQFTWTQVHDTMGNPLTGNDPIVTLLPGSSAQAPTFTAPAVANGLQQIDLVFRLTVSDGTASSGPSYVTIHVLNTNDPPLPALTVNGLSGDPVQVGQGTLVTLDGSTSTDPNPADIPNLTYKWEQVSGTAVTLSPPSGFSTDPLATFTAPAVGTMLTFRLTVSDGDFEVPKEVNILVVENNHPPVADAGQDQTVPEGAPADLNGSAFDPDSDTPLTFSWEQTAGPTVTLMSESPDNSHMSFVAPTFGGQGGSLTFKLTVTDTHNASHSDEVTVNVYPNRPPVPNGGNDQTVNENTTVGLNGSATDLDKNKLTYTWSQVSGPTVDLSDIHDPAATFMAPEVPCDGVVIVMTLTVNDGYVDAFDDVTINIANLNHDPTASAGGVQSVNEQQLVALNGSLSTDLDTEEIPSLTYQWMQTEGPGVTLAYDNVNDSQHIHPTFTAPDIPGGDPNATVTLKFSLTVTDLCGKSGTDTATVTVANFAHPPIAVVQGPATVNEHTSGVMLSGTGSYDLDGDSFGYNWTQCAGPAVTLTGADSATPSFDAPWVSAHTQLKFKLTVTDPYGLSSSAFVTVTVLNVNDPPTLVNPRADVGVLWPPNHQLVAVQVLGVVDPQNNATITINSVKQDEPTNGLGDGDTPIDAIINGDAVLLRAERAGNGNGRIYHVCFTAADPEGSVTGCVNVMVPKSKKTDAAVDGGSLYDSTH